MNLYLRLLWTFLRTFRSAGLRIGDTLEREMRVWPNDLDLNGHMNNGRYLTVIDLLLIEYFVRIGFARVMLKARWRPMSGGAFITYRKGLQPGQRYRVRFTLVGASEHWNFMRFEFLRMDGTLCAAGYTKGAAVGRNGLIPNAQSYARMGIPFECGAVPEPVRHWLVAEQELMRSAAA